MSLQIIRKPDRLREQVPYLWWQRLAAQSIPNDAWSTVLWDLHRNEEPTSDFFTVVGQTSRVKYSVPMLLAAVVDLSWALSGTGIRAIRYQQGGFSVAQIQDAGASDAPGASTHQHMQCAMQPGSATGGDSSYFEIQVYQNSGGALDLTVDGLQSPSLMCSFLSAF